jgi:hypothetical protein
MTGIFEPDSNPEGYEIQPEEYEYEDEPMNPDIVEAFDPIEEQDLIDLHVQELKDRNN